jgi:hypothetical protein
MREWRYAFLTCAPEKVSGQAALSLVRGSTVSIGEEDGGPELTWCCGEEKNLYLWQELNPDSQAIKPLIIYLFFHLLVNILSVCLFMYSSIYVWYSHNELFIYSFIYCLLCHGINIRLCIHFQKEMNCYFQTLDFFTIPLSHHELNRVPVGDQRCFTHVRGD